MENTTPYIMRASIYTLATALLETLSNPSDKGRYFLGITGCPAAGKSMLAKKLTDEINFRTGDELATVVPMDGFHLPNNALKERGLTNVKGAPETFDAGSFVKLINRLHEFQNQIIMCPAYNRKIHDPVGNAITIQPCNRLIIVEGNYLLLNSSPWHMIRTKMNEIWYVDTPLKRLLHRHIAGGASKGEAERKIVSVDLPNAKLIKKMLPLADKIVNPNS
jgi:pantothenate kinase